MGLLNGVLTETIAALVGIFVGTLAALAVDRYNERRRNRQRAGTILGSLAQEMAENQRILQAVKPAYLKTPFGKSFYISTIAWETAMASGDLAATIGFDLADSLATQYALFMRIRYYVNLLTQLWFAPAEIEGYEVIRQGFNRAIVETMHQAISRHPQMQGKIETALIPG